MKVVVTGASGFIGLPLTAALRRRGWDVLAVLRNPESAEAAVLTGLGARCARGDVTDPASLEAAMAGADIVIHNAGHYELGVDAAGRRRMQEVNVTGTDNVLAAALRQAVPRTVYVSTVQAFGDSGPEPRDESFVRRAPCRTQYERTKTDAHEIALGFQRRGLPLVIVCPDGVIGPNDHSVWGYFLRLYVNRLLPPVAWSPDSIYALVFVEDLAEGIALAAEKGSPGETYFLAGEPLSLREHFALWATRPGAFRVRLWLPPVLAALLFAPLEPLQRMLGLPAFMSRESVRAGATHWAYSNRKARRDLGWTVRPARAMWDATVDREIELTRLRRGRGLVARLRPLPTRTLFAGSPAADG